MTEAESVRRRRNKKARCEWVPMTANWWSATKLQFINQNHITIAVYVIRMIVAERIPRCDL